MTALPPPIRPLTAERAHLVGLPRLQRASREAVDTDGWVHEDDANEKCGGRWPSLLVALDLAEMRHTRPARPGDQGFTVWYRPKETP